MKGRVTSTALIVYLVASVVAGANPALACGWVLLMPPEVKGQADTTSAPFKTWSQLAAFDSAKECEAGRKKAAKDMDETFQKLQRGELVARDKTPQQASEFVGGTLFALLSSACVATDDPRLAK